MSDTLFHESPIAKSEWIPLIDRLNSDSAGCTTRLRAAIRREAHRPQVASTPPAVGGAKVVLKEIGIWINHVRLCNDESIVERQKMHNGRAARWVLGKLMFSVNCIRMELSRSVNVF